MLRWYRLSLDQRRPILEGRINDDDFQLNGETIRNSRQLSTFSLVSVASDDLCLNRAQLGVEAVNLARN